VLPPEVRAALLLLSQTTLTAIQDHIKAIEIARQMTDDADTHDTESFLEAIWRMLRAERICDDLLRNTRRHIVRQLADAPVLYSLTTELADHIENTTDHLLSAGHALRHIVFQKTGAHA